MYILCYVYYVRAKSTGKELDKFESKELSYQVYTYVLACVCIA